MKKATTIAAACVAAGCSSLPQHVEVPVPVPCTVELPAPPTWATEALQPGADIFDQVKALLAERRQRIAYETKLEAAARSCAAL